MLSIRDEQVRTLAQDVMRKTGAPTITAAIKLALQNEVARTEDKVSLRERVDALRRKILGDGVRPREKPLTKEERDALWE